MSAQAQIRELVQATIAPLQEQIVELTFAVQKLTERVRDLEEKSTGRHAAPAKATAAGTGSGGSTTAKAQTAQGKGTSG